MKNLYIVILFIFTIPTFCQTRNNITGFYLCIEDEMNLLTREHRIRINYIETKQINSDSIKLWPIVGDTTIAKLKGDSLFFTYDSFGNSNFKAHAEGKGCFYPDSINIKYFEHMMGYEAFYIEISGHKLPTGFSILETSKPLKCFPNPFIDKIHLTYASPDSSDKILFNLYSSTGQLLRKIEIVENGQSTKTIYLGDLEKGIYLGVVTINNRYYSKTKLVKE